MTSIYALAKKFEEYYAHSCLEKNYLNPLNNRALDFNNFFRSFSDQNLLRQHKMKKIEWPHLANVHVSYTVHLCHCYILRHKQVYAVLANSSAAIETTDAAGAYMEGNWLKEAVGRRRLEKLDEPGSIH
jgi:hypothetical protein